MMSSEEGTFEMVDPPKTTPVETPNPLPPPSALPPALTAALPPPSTTAARPRPRNPFAQPPPPSAFAPPPPLPKVTTQLPPPAPTPVAKETTPPPPSPPKAKTQTPPPPPPVKEVSTTPTEQRVGTTFTLPVDPGLLGTSPLTAVADDERTSVEEEELPDLIGWIAGSNFFNKAVAKARAGVDQMITTLDPQMREFVDATGSVELAIASDQEFLIGAVKDGFQRAFNSVTARGMGSPGSTDSATTPSSHKAALTLARQRIANLRASGLAPKGIPIVAVVEFAWSEEGAEEAQAAEVAALDDPGAGLSLHIYSASTPLSAKILHILKSHTPADYAWAGSGWAIAIGQAVAEETGCNPHEWKDVVLGISRRQSLVCLFQALAALYKKRLLKDAQN